MCASRRAFCAALVLVLAWAVGGPPSTVSGHQNGHIASAPGIVELRSCAPTSGGPSPAARLARGVGAGSFADGVRATTETLTRGGVAVVGPGGRVTDQAKAPRSGLLVTRTEVLNMALEARCRRLGAAMGLHELAPRLKAAGFPLGKGTANHQMVRFLRAWVRAARKRPQDPQNFTPLFLAEMARRGTPSIDLARGDYAPREYRLGLLEMDLLAAAVPRAAGGGRRAGRSRAIAAAKPCSDMKKLMDEHVPSGTANELAGREITKKSIGIAIDSVNAGKVGALTAKQFSNAVAAMNIAMRVQKLVKIYGHINVIVYNARTNAVHKPRDRPNVESSVKEGFIATVGLSKEDWDAYRGLVEALGQENTETARAAIDCLGSLGFASPTTVGDLAAALKEWRIAWRYDVSGVQGAHSTLDLEGSAFDAGLLRHTVKRISDYQGGAAIVVNVKPERDDDHQGGDGLRVVGRTATATATAEVKTATPPSISTFVSAAKGGLGLASALVELGAGWMQTALSPSDSATLDIGYHEVVCERAARTRSARAAQSCGGGSGHTATFQLDIAVTDEATACGQDTESYRITGDFPTPFEVPGSSIRPGPRSTATGTYSGPCRPCTAALTPADTHNFVVGVWKAGSRYKVSASGPASWRDPSGCHGSGGTGNIPGAYGSFSASRLDDATITVPVTFSELRAGTRTEVRGTVTLRRR